MTHTMYMMDREEVEEPLLTSSPGENTSVLILSSDFKSIKESPYFVDKTLFLKQWFDFNTDHLYVTAPPRFGKSSLVNMMTIFYGATYEVVDGTLKEMSTEETPALELFKGTKIFTEENAFFENHFGKYLVLQLSFADLVFVSDYESFQHCIFTVMSNILEPFEYTLEDQNIDTEWGDWIRNYNRQSDRELEPTEIFQFGTKILNFLHDIFKKPVILVVDDFDSILLAHMKEDKVQDSAEILMQLGMFVKSFVKSETGATFERTIIRSYVTGSLNLGGMVTSLVSNLYHIDYFCNESMATFYGFTKEEVQNLLKKENRTDECEKFEDFYDGYSVINSNLRLFNILSVIMYLSFKGLKHYTETMSPSNFILNKYIDAFSTQQIGLKVCQCLYEKECGIEILSGVGFVQLEHLRNNILDSLRTREMLSDEDVSLFLTILMELGYFSVLRTTERAEYVIRPTNSKKMGVETIIMELFLEDLDD